MCLCCASNPVVCQNGPAKNLVACHCFIRVSEKLSSCADTPTTADFHGGFDLSKLQECCNCLPLLKAWDIDLSLFGQPRCRPLVLPNGERATADCDELRACLAEQSEVMTDRKLCYGYCLSPNSNTFAFNIGAACGQKLLSPDFMMPDLSKNPWKRLLEDCAAAGAPGYGFFWPDAMTQDDCDGRKPGETR